MSHKILSSTLAAAALMQRRTGKRQQRLADVAFHLDKDVHLQHSGLVRNVVLILHTFLELLVRTSVIPLMRRPQRKYAPSKRDYQQLL